MSAFFVALALAALSAGCLAQDEPYCLRWNLTSTCYKQTIYPLTTNENFFSFYQYAAPFGASANTGLELTGVAQTFILKSNVGAIGPNGTAVAPVFTLTTILDKPQDFSGGGVNMVITAVNMSFLSQDTNSTMTPTQTGWGPMLVQDDRNPSDRYLWIPSVTGTCASGCPDPLAPVSSATCGNGLRCGCDCVSVVQANWTWAPCCTDGLTFGPILDSTNASAPFWRVEYTYTTRNFQTNSTGHVMPDPMSLIVRSYNPGGATLRLPIPWQRGERPDFTIEPGACPPPPNCALDCFSCRSTPECGWCGASETCAERVCDPAFGACPLDARNASCPVEVFCGSKTDCVSCSVEPLCGWCPARNECLAMAAMERAYAYCPVSVYNTASLCSAPATPATVDLSAPLPGKQKSVPVALIAGVIAAAFVLALLVGFLVYKLVRLPSDVTELVGFDSMSDIKSNALYEEKQGFQSSALYDR